MSSHRVSRTPHWDIGAPGVKALTIFAVLLAGIAAFVSWRGRPEVAPLAPPPPVGSFAPSRSTPMPGGTLVVAVSGRVKKPGLVRLPAGSRVADAIDAAGGLLPDTDTSTLNLARKVND